MRTLRVICLAIFLLASVFLRDGTEGRFSVSNKIKKDDPKGMPSQSLANNRRESGQTEAMPFEEATADANQDFGQSTGSNWFHLINNNYAQAQNTKQAQRHLVELLQEFGLGAIDEGDIDHRVRFDALNSLLWLRGKPMVDFFVKALEQLSSGRDKLASVGVQLVEDMFEYDFCYFTSEDMKNYDCADRDVVADRLSDVIDSMMSTTTTTTTTTTTPSPSPLSSLSSLWSSLFAHRYYRNAPFAHVRGNASEPGIIYVARPPMIG